MPDSLVEKSHEIREQLMTEFGGLDGLCDKLEEMDAEREQKEAVRKQPSRQGKSGGTSGRSRPAKGSGGRK